MNKIDQIEICPATRPRRFYDCSLNEKLLYTSFLLLMGIAYLMALTYLYTSFEDIDGQPGLSAEDVAENYYGNRSGTRLESVLRGSMANYIDADDRYRITTWLMSGASESGYESTVKPILAQRCVVCHNPDSGQNVLDLTRYAGIKQVADVNTGVSLHSLMRVSHIHLFGVALVALGIGLIFRFTLLPPWLQHTLTLMPFIAIFTDILAWFLTKWDPVFAYTVMAAGGLLGLSWVLQITISLYQIWFLRCRVVQERDNPEQ